MEYPLGKVSGDSVSVCTVKNGRAEGGEEDLTVSLSSGRGQEGESAAELHGGGWLVGKSVRLLLVDTRRTKSPPGRRNGGSYIIFQNTNQHCLTHSPSP